MYVISWWVSPDEHNINLSRNDDKLNVNNFNLIKNFNNLKIKKRGIVIKRLLMQQNLSCT